jgi:hypothetical protein
MHSIWTDDDELDIPVYPVGETLPQVRDESIKFGVLSLISCIHMTLCVIWQQLSYSFSGVNRISMFDCVRDEEIYRV